MKIGIASDHRGYVLKKEIIKELKNEYEIIDFGTDSEERVDYPDYAFKLGKAIQNKDIDLGIAICGTGIGISIACNKINGIRASVCTDKYMAQMTRQDNDANVLCLGSRLKIDNVLGIVDEYLNTEFSGGRHQRRVDKIKKLEKCQKDGVEYGDCL